MDYVELAKHCGSEVNPVTTVAIIRAESSFDPLAIRDNSLSITYHPKTKEDAESKVKLLYGHGHKLAIGLMQITNPWVRTYNLKPQELFNPCINIRIGTHILAENYRTYLPLSASKDEALKHAISAYWTGNPDNGGSYINYVFGKAGSDIRVNETPGISDGILGNRPSYSKILDSNPSVLSSPITFPVDSGKSLIMSR